MGSPGQHFSGPNLGHSTCHPGLASGYSLRWPRSASPVVPGSPSGSHLGLGPRVSALGLWRPPVTASVWLPFVYPSLLAWGPGRPPPLGCLWEHVCGKRLCQGQQGTGTDKPTVPSYTDPCPPHTLINSLEQSGGGAGIAVTFLVHISHDE